LVAVGVVPDQASWEALVVAVSIITPKVHPPRVVPEPPVKVVRAVRVARRIRAIVVEPAVERLLLVPASVAMVALVPHLRLRGVLSLEPVGLRVPPAEEWGASVAEARAPAVAEPLIPEVAEPPMAETVVPVW
jgi:hypothetical protein